MNHTASGAGYLGFWLNLDEFGSGLNSLQA